MTIHLSLDRFEGDAKGVAVLLTDDGTSINFPASLLPSGSKPGDILNFTIARDSGATKKVADATKKVQADLARGDTGGDIKL